MTNRRQYPEGVLSWAQLAVFVPAAVAVAASPGANNLLAFRNGVQSGFRNASLALSGRFLAFAIMLTLVIAGLGTLLNTSQPAFEALRFLGATFMIGLGLWVMWSARPQGDEHRNTGTTRTHPPRHSSAWKLATQEFVTAGANPKALLLFTAFLPPFVDTTQNTTATGVQLALLGVLYIVCEVVTALVWAGSGWLLGSRGLRRRTLRRLDQASGSLLVVFGAGLALSDLTRR